MKIQEVFGKNNGLNDSSRLDISKNEVSHSYSDRKPKEVFKEDDVSQRAETIAALKKFQEFANNNWKTPITKPRKFQNNKQTEVNQNQ